jgi:hypothetical protein
MNIPSGTEMNQKTMGATHKALSNLNQAIDLVHHHMDGTKRYRAEKLLAEVKESLRVIHIECLQCPDGDTEP